MSVRIEVINNVFTKYHLEGTGIALHHFTGIDNDYPHDHPWDFSSRIIFGGYWEKVYRIKDGKWSSELIRRKLGNTFFLNAEHIHEINELPEGECWTEVRAEPERRKWCNYKFTSDGILVRQHGKSDFEPLIL